MAGIGQRRRSGARGLCATGTALSLVIAQGVPALAQASEAGPAHANVAFGAALPPAVALTTSRLSTIPIGLNLNLIAAPSKYGSSGAITAESADEARDEARQEAADAREREDWNGVAEKLRTAAEDLGDPVLMLESAEARLTLADETRTIEEAEKSIETTRVALDMLYFYQDVANGEAETRWLVIDPDRARELIDEADERIAAAQTLIEQIQGTSPSGNEPGAGSAKKKKPKAGGKSKDKGKATDDKKAGAGLIGTGAAFTGLGIAGIVVAIGGVVTGASRQNQVEELDLTMDQEEIERLDAQGARANKVAIAGGVIAGLGLIIGIPLLAIGIKRRNAGRGPSANASVRLMPELSRTRAGLVLSARF